MSRPALTAEKEQREDADLLGTKRKRSAKFWQNDLICEMALMARKLRKGNIQDEYTPIIERQLGQIKIAIDLLVADPLLAKEYGENGEGVQGILDMLETKAAKYEADLVFGAAAKKYLENTPGHQLNQKVQSRVLNRPGQVPGQQAINQPQGGGA